MSKKIAVVVGVFPSVSEAFIVNQIEYLINTGHKVHVFATRELDDINPLFSSEKYKGLIAKTQLLSNKGVLPNSIIIRFAKAIKLLLKFRLTIHLLKTFNVFKYGKDALNFKVFYRLYYQYFFTINNYDIVHIHFGDNAVHLKNQIKNFDKKVLLSFHGYDAHKFDAEFYKPLLDYKNLRLTVNTNYTASKVRQLGFQNKIYVLPVGLDTKFFKPIDYQSSEEKHSIKLLFVGRLVEFKAPLIAISIVEELIKRGVSAEMNIIGDGPLLAKCKSVIIEKNLSNCVYLHGSKSQKEIVEMMNASTIFVYPGIVDETGRCENQGLVLQEAQAMQLPVVTSNVGGISDGLIDDETGFLVNEKNIDEFVSKILWLINNPSERKAMGEAGREFVKANYDSEILGEKLLIIYDSKNYNE
ncbi:glycosyltransferase [uncultured Winogradskyella sp.]|uniref:glycosyltransferase n=1 Tax=uncultured Winogradskyella sp. TaxID=395353 RepID=UPI002604FBC1|nr:glycosyltransferase [uncultured Winogradskyella sp.]